MSPVQSGSFLPAVRASSLESCPQSDRHHQQRVLDGILLLRHTNNCDIFSGLVTLGCQVLYFPNDALAVLEFSEDNLVEHER